MNDNIFPASVDIAVVGGGMVGVSLALLLARANSGCRIALLESFPLRSSAGAAYQSSFDARSTALSAGSRKIFESCDIWESLSEHVTPIRRVHVSDKGHFGGCKIDGRDHGLDAVGYVVENAWLGRILLTQLQQQKNIHCIAPAAVAQVEAAPDGYRLIIEEKGQITCGLLALADGADSRLREQLGIGVSRRDYRQSAIVANVRSDRPHQGIAYERFTAEGPVALLPLGESDESTTMALVWTQPRERAAEFQACSETDFLRRLQRHFGHRQGTFFEVSRRHLYPLELSVAKEQIRRSLVLMGNAAHFLHPVAGQGFNLALRDCQALSECLAAGSEAGIPFGDLRLLQNYQERQRGDQWATIQMSDQFVRWFSSSDPGKSILRNLGFFALDLLPPLKTAFARQTMGLNTG